MLAYLFDPLLGEELLAELAATKANRVGRMERILLRLNSAGYEIQMSEVMAQLAPGATLGRPHLADALVAKGYFNHRNDVFTDLLHNNSPHYVAHYSPTPERVIKLINAAGGVAVLAHPLASSRGRVIDWEEFSRLKRAGLAGVEVSHRDNDPAAASKLIEVCQELELIQTGSSDYHGAGKLNELGEFMTKPEAYEQILARASTVPITK
jgi:predicted metal-dependent phosphoesterase TrpH